MHNPVEPGKSSQLSSADVAGNRTASHRIYIGIAVVVIAVGSALLYRGGFARKTTPLATTQSALAFVKEGNRIRIPEGSPLRSQLTVQPVVQKEIVRNLIIPAVVEADPARLMKVLPPVAGRVTELKVRLGERVVRGQPLMVLDSPDLRSAYAEYDRGKVLFELAAKNRDRLHSLGVGGGIALKDVQQVDADYITAEAEFQRTEARLRQIGVDPNAANKSRIVVIAAPISGSILDLSVAPGAVWNDTTSSLLTIADLSTIFVTASVPEKDTTRVTEGQPIEVSLAAYPGEPLKGVVSFISDALDADTRSIKARIVFDNPKARLKPGMFANVTFFSPKELVPAIPVSALLLRDDLTQVFVEVAPWTFEERPVEIRFQREDEAVVQTGLQAGDHVIVRGGVLLND